MKAYIYCRISKKKSDGNKLQIDKCINYCNDNHIHIAKIYEHSKSSRNMQNSKFLEHIIDNDMQAGDILIVHSICRFSRNMSGGLLILDKLEKKKIKIYSVDDKIGYDNIHDRFRFRQIMNCAELESDQISHRVKQSFNNKINRQKRQIDNKTYDNKTYEKRRKFNSLIDTPLLILNKNK